ncbi:Xre family transcriptional regulator [Melghiribacillus thermohalophilus]|uniref:Xre family transcriptional regulator n=1 Tax=Melghiribacillus thermohalophilus TaxID=1324956 RepID=A0A4R3NEG9_9BACI|nr:helix-turn-helix domain-containing protein [Melghiribacillus thermohalophilus]TCT25612.1 Xre family transcriptional regulator [Melghiribacillus thermohalophilus]
MNKDILVESLSPKIKLVRAEQGYTQERMANILGISKKTLVQIEKGRNLASWTTIVALCSLFRHSDVIQNELGEDVLEVVETVALETVERPIKKTLGGKVWWTDMLQNNGYILQQNLISKHFRIIDHNNYRYYSTFNKQEAMEKLHELTER